MEFRMSRRKFVQSVAAVGVADLVVKGGAMAEVMPGQGGGRQRIDVHHHILPPEYVSIVGEGTIGAPAPNRGTPKWTVERSINAMNDNGIVSAVTSISAPGIWFNDAKKAKYLARSCNTFAAQMMADHPGRFGSFASLPLPDVAAAMVEVKHALDELKANGVVLMTNYGDRYLGDPEFAPLFDELNARSAVVYVHPTTCNCSAGVMADIPASMIEFPHDSTRTIVSLMYAGIFSRCKNIKFVFSHAGGTLPFLANRIALLGKLHTPFAERVPEGVLEVIKGLNFDTALSANGVQIPALLKLVSTKNVMLGTDFPFGPEVAMKAQIKGLSDIGLSDGELRDIEFENARRLFGDLKGAKSAAT